MRNFCNFAGLVILGLIVEGRFQESFVSIYWHILRILKPNQMNRVLFFLTIFLNHFYRLGRLKKNCLKFFNIFF